MDQTNWGPLTNIFTPPSSCISTLTEGTRPTPFLYQGHWGIANLDVSCYPPATVPASWLYQTLAWNAYYYSPGVLCPSGYTTAQTFQKAIPEYQFSISMGTDTSAALCCPSQYDYFGDDGHICAWTVNPGFVATYFDLASTLQTTTFASSMIISGNGVPIVWQSTDLKAVSTSTSFKTAIITSHSPITSNSIKPTTGPTTTASSPLATSSNTATSKDGLSTGAAVGLGVGVTLGVIAILLLGVAMWYIRRLKAKNKASAASEDRARPEGAERSAEVVEAAGVTPEILTEPTAYHNRHELPSGIKKPQELP